MRSLITTLLAIGLATPTSGAYALWIDNMIDNAKAGNGTYIESHASAESGGQTAAAGQTVTTGNASASSRVETHSGTSGGEVKVKVETSENGNANTEEYTKSFAPGVGTKVDVHASSKNGVSTSTIRVNGAEVLPQKSTDSEASPRNSEATPPLPTHVESQIKTFFSVKIPAILSHIFSFFWLL